MTLDLGAFSNLYKKVAEIAIDERVDRVLDVNLGSQGTGEQIHEWVQKATNKKRGARKTYTLSDAIKHFGKGF